MIPTLRDYQQEAVDRTVTYISRPENAGRNPLIVLPTGAGKSHVIAGLIKHAVTNWRGSRWLMATHVKELIEQNMEKVLQHMPGANAGIYCAGLSRRDVGAQITGASIQSVFRRAAAFGHIDGMIIDECHLVPKKGEGMYRTFIRDLQAIRPGMKVIGLTATPYRLKGGQLHVGKNRMFHDIVCNVDVLDLINRGFLAPLVGKATTSPIDTDNIAIRNGDFKQDELEAAAMSDELVDGAADEMIRYGHDRSSWLVFGCGVSHAEMILQALLARGVQAELVTGETPASERADCIERFKAKKLKCLVNVGVFTTGFDAPGVDLLAVLRPTKSPGLYVQIAGRGLRTAPGKSDCLFLDYGRNIERHGPINMVQARAGGDGGGAVPVKACPDCNTYVLIGVMTCPECGYRWEPGQNPIPHDHDKEASDLQVIDDGTMAEFEVANVSVNIHNSLWGKAPTLRVTYESNIFIREWVPFETARHRADAWWKQRGGSDPVPETAADAFERQGELRHPSHILARKKGKYWEVAKCKFAASKTE